MAILFLASLSAQTISNVQARQEGLEIIITYDMSGKLQSKDEIKVGYSTDGGRNYKPISNAAGGKEISSAWPEKKHGLFSYYLMKGMRGEADENNDNQITVGELGDYVKEHVSDMAGMLDREQTPGLQTLDEQKVLISY